MLATFTFMTTISSVMAETTTTTAMTAGGMTKNTGNGLIIDQNSNGQYDGDITGTGSLTATNSTGNSATIVTLNGENTYTGPTIVDSGTGDVTLSLGADAKMASSEYIVQNSGTLDLSKVANFTVDNLILKSTGSVLGASGNTVIFMGDIEGDLKTTGSVEISKNVSIENTGSILADKGITIDTNSSLFRNDNASLGSSLITNNGTLEINTDNSLTMDNIGGNGLLIKSGSGDLVLNDPGITKAGVTTDQFTGNLSVKSGSLTIDTDASTSFRHTFNSIDVAKDAVINSGLPAVSSHGGDSDPTLDVNTLTGDGTINLKGGNLRVGYNGSVTGAQLTNLTINGIGNNGTTGDSGSEILLYGNGGATQYGFKSITGSELELTNASALLGNLSVEEADLIKNSTLTLNDTSTIKRIGFDSTSQTNASSIIVNGNLHTTYTSNYAGQQTATSFIINKNGSLVIDSASDPYSGFDYEGALTNNGSIEIDGTTVKLGADNALYGSGDLTYANGSTTNMLNLSEDKYSGTINVTNASALRINLGTTFSSTIGKMDGMVGLMGNGSSDLIHITMNSDGNGALVIQNANVQLSGRNDTTASGSMTDPASGNKVNYVNNVYAGQVIASASMLGSGQWNLSNGTLDIVDDGNEVLSNDIRDNSAMGASGSITIEGKGTTTVTGTNSYTGETHINSGTTVVNGDETAATGLTTVASGARLEGSGIIGGSVAMSSGSILSAGNSNQTGTLTINGDLDTTGSTQYFREASVAGGSGNDLISIAGNLTLGGIIDVSNTNGVNFGDGIYRLYTYGGSLSGMATLSASNLDTANAVLQTSVAHQVSMVVSGATNTGGGAPIIFWNGGSQAGAITGGDGVWGENKNWTDENAKTVGNHSSGQIAIFTGNAGVVKVSPDASSVSALQFANTDNKQYLLTGGAINAASDTLGIRVGDGTSSGKSISAIIASTISDTNGKTSVNKTDLGTIILSGDNTYSGGTVVNAGAIGVENSNAVGSGNISMQNGTALLLANGVSLNNSISLSGDPTFTVSAGESTIAGDISDGASPGDLVKEGNGTLFLTGNNTYSGNTDINAGTLDVNGNISNSDITVNSGGVLKGSGEVGNTDGKNGSIIDTTSGLSFSKNLTIDNGELIAKQGNVISVAGNTTLNGGILNYEINRLTVGKDITVLNSGGSINGMFSSTEISNKNGDQYVYVSPSVIYNPNQIILTYTRNNTSFGGGTHNQNAVGVSVDNMKQGAILDAFEEMTTPQVRRAENMLSGEMLSSERTILIQNTDVIRSAVFDRLSSSNCYYDSAMAMYDVKTGKRISRGCQATGAVLWGQAFGTLGSNGASEGTLGVSHSSAGFIMGVDREFGLWRAGTVLSYGRSNMNTNALASSAHSNDVSIGIYGGRSWNALSLRLGASYTWNMISSRRNIVTDNMNFGKVNADHLGGTSQAFAELAYHLNVSGVNIEPFANVAYVNQQMSGYHESGSVAALHIRSSDMGTTFASVGSRFSKRIKLNNGADLIPYASIGYRHAFGHMTPKMHASWTGGIDMDIYGAPLTQDAIVTELGTSYNLSDRIALKVGYRGQYGQHYNNNGITGSFSLKF